MVFLNMVAFWNTALLNQQNNQTDRQTKKNRSSSKFVTHTTDQLQRAASYIVKDGTNCVQTHIFSKFQGLTLTYRLFSQSCGLCISNVETVGAYLSREKSFWKATNGVEGWGKKSGSFSLSFHVNMSLYSSSHLKCSLYICLWNNNYS